MPNKCAVFGCKSGYLSGQTIPIFKFPKDEHKSLQELWIKFLNRENYIVTPQRDLVLTTLKINTLCKAINDRGLYLTVIILYLRLILIFFL